ncbi:MAG TPA: tetratricopeptide repeat protein [Clostridiales bacterium]|nr:tetratricopeptide repeat protein [Clostridiales bacterium]
MSKKVVRVFIIALSLSFLTGCSTKSSSHYYKKGNLAMSKSNYENAVNDYMMAVQINPNKADYIISYAQALILKGNNEIAIEELDKISFDKDLKIIQQNNKKIHILKGLALYNLGRYEEALIEYNKALDIEELTNLNLDILLYKAVLLNKQELFIESIEILEKIIDSDNTKSEVFATIANSYFMIGDYDKALENYELAISIEKSNFDYHINLYNVYMKQNNLNAANNVFNNFEIKELNTKTSRFNQARIYFYQKEYDRALTEFELLANDSFIESYFYIGEIHSENKDIDLAINYYEKYIENNNNLNQNNYVFNKLGNLYMKKQDYKKALNIYEKGIDLYDKSFIQVFKRNEIVVYEKLGKYEQAYEKTKEYLKEYPNDDSAIREEEFLKMILEEEVAYESN